MLYCADEITLSDQETEPAPLVFRTWFTVPSVVGNVYELPIETAPLYETLNLLVPPICALNKSPINVLAVLIANIVPFMFPFQETEPPRSFTFAELDDTASKGNPVSLNVLVVASKH